MPIPGARRSLGIALPGVRAAAVGFIRGTPTPTQAETTALLAAMTIQPSASRQVLINDTIFALKNAGLWSTFDLFYVAAAHDPQAGRLNWVAPGTNTLSVNGTPTFSTDRGYLGLDSATYLGTGVLLSALTKFLQDNCCIGCWCQNDSVNANPLLGTALVNCATMIPRNVSNQLACRINSTNASVQPVVSAAGHGLAARTASTGFDLYKNNTLLVSATAASIARTTNEVTFLRHTATLPNNTHILAAAHYGAALNSTQIAALYSILVNYMTGVGAA